MSRVLVKLPSFHALAMFLRHGIGVVETRGPGSRPKDSLKGRGGRPGAFRNGSNLRATVGERGEGMYVVGWLSVGGRDKLERHRAESQWIMAAKPLYHLQYPVAYLS